MGWLQTRVVKVDGLRVELDHLDSSKIEKGEIPTQPPVFVVKTNLPCGLNQKRGYVLCKIGNELVQSGGPFRSIIVPIAYAFEGDTEWTEDDVWHKGWHYAAFVIGLGHEYEEDEYGQSQDLGYKGIRFIPDHDAGHRLGQYVLWITTGYNGEGYWSDEGDAFPLEWDEVVEIANRPLQRMLAKNVVVLPDGDTAFLTEQ